MSRKPVFRAALAALFAVALAPTLPAPAAAQGVVALVNNQAITSFDIEQRMRIAATVDRRRLDRKSALQELIDDKVKLIEARRVGYRVTEEGVENEFSRFAKNNRMTTLEFEDNLKRAGLQPSALRDKIRSDLAWVVLLRDQARRGSQVSNAELESAVEKRRRETGTITEYHLTPVVFIVPQGSSPGARAAAANAARARFTSCETGLDELRKLPDVAIRPNTIRTSAELGKPMLAVLDKIPVGRLTPPSPSPQGIEMVAICEKKTIQDNNTARSEAATELSERKITENSKAYLQELRKKVDIKLR
jgi:peptidyl-prolyl cis-trans isomerase SurA